MKVAAQASYALNRADNRPISTLRETKYSPSVASFQSSRSWRG